MRHRLSQLMDVARDNDRLFDKTRRLVLALLDAGSLEEVVGAVEDSLRHEFQVPSSASSCSATTPLGVGRSVSSGRGPPGHRRPSAAARPQACCARPSWSFIFGADECTPGRFWPPWSA